MARGVYGQLQGDESRTGNAKAHEHYADNGVAEGEAVKALHAFMKGGRWDKAAEYMESLRLQGWADFRISAVYGQASHGVRLA